MSSSFQKKWRKARECGTLLSKVGNMFMGEYQNALDAKGRLIASAKFREALGETFVLTRDS